MTSLDSMLARRVRQADSDRELGFVWVNESMGLTPYRQAVLWLEESGVWALSGVVQIDANVPYVQWVNSVCRHLRDRCGLSAQPVPLTAADLPTDLAAEWPQWWPAHALWVGAGDQGLAAKVSGAGLFLRDQPWDANDLKIIEDWAEVWWHAFAALHRTHHTRWETWKQKGQELLAWKANAPWWQQRRTLITFGLLAAICFPVRMSILAPGELVPAHPTVVRAPIEGVIDTFHVQPNQVIKVDQPLFGFDELVIKSRLDVALQTLATAEVDYRQTSQLALSDSKSKSQLGLLAGRVEERRAEAQSLQEQLSRARVLAPQAGVVLMDDPLDWIGKPVITGERILRIATLDDVEVEAWVPLADAIALQTGDRVSLYLSASPMAPVSARLRYMSHEAVQRPDGAFAYRVRATLDGPTTHRVGLKGTAKLQGDWVPLVYWIMRRPLATARAYLGW
jgi:hypothetical protein